MTNRDRWNHRYAERGALWGAEPNRFVAERLAGLAPCRVLDLGAGQGRNAIWLAQQGHDVTAVDISDVAMGQARELATAAGVDVDFIAADLSQWEPEPAAFDLVLLAYLQMPAELRAVVHEKAAAALKPGGEIFLVGHHVDNLVSGVGGPPDPAMLFCEEDLAADFAEIEIIENRKVLRPVADGTVAGNAVDIIFRAKK